MIESCFPRGKNSSIRQVTSGYVSKTKNTNFKSKGHQGLKCWNAKKAQHFQSNATCRALQLTKSSRESKPWLPTKPDSTDFNRAKAGFCLTWLVKKLVLNLDFLTRILTAKSDNLPVNFRYWQQIHLQGSWPRWQCWGHRAKRSINFEFWTTVNSGVVDHCTRGQSHVVTKHAILTQTTHYALD